MRLENLNKTLTNEKARVTADIIWEDCDRPPFEVHFETQGPAAADIDRDPNAFLVACLMPAMHFGERRIYTSEEICPELLHGLETNMRWFQHWSNGQMTPLKIECKLSRVDRSRVPGRHAASFLSGGLDSLATLRSNRLDFPLEHSAAIRDCIMVHGFDIGGTTAAGKEEDYLDRSMAAAHKIAQDAEVNLIPIATNARLLYEDTAFWMHYFHGAALASIAHALSRRVTRVHIASSLLTSPVPWGSHPLVDPNYGSYATQIRHDGLHLTRLEKVRLIADWEVALQNLRVCTFNPDIGLNCGACEKCLRTMLELLAVGKLEAASSFPIQRVEPGMLHALKIATDYQASMYLELLEPLSAAGHHAIVTVIRAKLADFEKHQAWEQEKDWKGAVKRFDRRFLGSGLHRSWKVLRPNVQKISGRTQDR